MKFLNFNMSYNMVWRVKVIEYDPTTELEGYSFYDFDDDMTAWRFREFIMRARNVLAVYCPYRIEY